MELWILDKEKANLIKVDNIYIEEFYERDTKFYYEIRTKKYDDEVCMGWYSTKERAFEIIKEIKRTLEENITLKCAIYEMPSE